MRIRSVTFLTFCLVAVSWRATAQTKPEVKARVASNTCDCLQKKAKEKPVESLSEEQAMVVLSQCFGASLDKETPRVQADNAEGARIVDLRLRLAQEASVLMEKNCPSFVQISNKLKKPAPDDQRP